MTPRRQQIALDVIAGLKDNLAWFPRYQACLRDLPAAEPHLLPDGGHWLLETHLDEVTSLMWDFLSRTLG